MGAVGSAWTLFRDLPFHSQRHNGRAVLSRESVLGNTSAHWVLCTQREETHTLKCTSWGQECECLFGHTWHVVAQWKMTVSLVSEMSSLSETQKEVESSSDRHQQLRDMSLDITLSKMHPILLHILLSLKVLCIFLLSFDVSRLWIFRYQGLGEFGLLFNHLHLRVNCQVEARSGSQHCGNSWLLLIHG